MVVFDGGWFEEDAVDGAVYVVLWCDECEQDTAHREDGYDDAECVCVICGTVRGRDG